MEEEVHNVAIMCEYKDKMDGMFLKDGTVHLIVRLLSERSCVRIASGTEQEPYIR